MLTAQKGLPMNRTSRASLPSQILVFLTVLCMPAVVRAVTVATPTFSPAAGTYTSAQTVTISDTTSGSTIYYTTNGSTPTTTSTKFTSAITVSASETLKAIATASGDTNSAVATAAYTLVAPTPALSLAAGSYGSSQTETITDSNSAATIYYTTNGTTPTTSSTKYAAAFTVNASETVEAIAVVSGYSNSATVSAAYTFVAPTPKLSLAAGSYGSSQTETITDSNSAATIYYTTNGTTPTTSSTKYTAAFTVNASETVEAIAVITGYSNSATASAAYTFLTPAPSFSLAAGSYYGSQTVTLSDSNSSATIYERDDADDLVDQVLRCHHRECDGDHQCDGRRLRLLAIRNGYCGLHDHDNFGHAEYLSLSASGGVKHRCGGCYGDIRCARRWEVYVSLCVDCRNRHLLCQFNRSLRNHGS